MVLVNMLSVFVLLYEIMWLESKMVFVLMRCNVKIECLVYCKLLSMSRLL